MSFEIGKPQFMLVTTTMFGADDVPLFRPRGFVVL